MSNTRGIHIYENISEGAKNLVDLFDHLATPYKKAKIYYSCLGTNVW